MLRSNLMLVSTAFESARLRGSGEILADVLAQQGSLALDVCLRYSTDIATELRAMHQDGRAHGAVHPGNVALRSSGATLLAVKRRGYADPLADLIGFGAVLYAMLTDNEASGDQFRLVPAKPGILKGPAGVRDAATRLAERCLTAERETAPDLQKVLTEVRLLSVMAKQFSSEPVSLHIAPAPSVTYPPSQPLEVFAGKAPPIIHPPGGGTTTPQVDSPDVAKPGDDSPLTLRSKASHSRPVLKDVICPNCGGYHVRLSRPRTIFENVLNLFGMGAHRCHRCFYRYIPIFERKIARVEK